MLKWVLGLSISLYAVLILFGGEGYDADKYADAQPRAATNRVIETVEVTRAPAQDTVPVIAETAASLTTEPTESQDGDLITPIQTAALDEKIDAIVSQVTEVVADETRPTLVLQSPSETLAATTLIQPEPETASTNASPVGQIWTVTGSRVNLRAGASTNDGIVGRTFRGESAEIVEMLNNGWAKVYIIETGIEAYMSADFLSSGRG